MTLGKNRPSVFAKLCREARHDTNQNNQNKIELKMSHNNSNCSAAFCAETHDATPVYTRAKIFTPSLPNGDAGYASHKVEMPAADSA